MTETKISEGTRLLAEWAVASLCDSQFAPDKLDHYEPTWWLVYSDWLTERGDGRAGDARMVARLLPLGMFPDTSQCGPGRIYGWWKGGNLINLDVFPEHSHVDRLMFMFDEYLMEPQNSILAALQELDSALIKHNAY